MSRPELADAFRRLEREVLVDNAWHRYCRDRYRLPGGGDGDYYYVDMPGSAGTIPLFEDGSTVLLEVHRYLLGQTLWEFPIGGMLDGETAEEVARKELAEESGLLAREWTALGSFAPYKGVSNEVCHFFLARGLEEGEQKLEATEAIRPHRMPMEEARRLLLESPLGDGQSLTGLLYYDRWCARQADGADARP